MIVNRPLYIDGNYVGDFNAHFVTGIRADYYWAHKELQKVQFKPHRVYGYTLYDKDGGTKAYYLFYNNSKIDDMYDEISSWENCKVYDVYKA